MSDLLPPSDGLEWNDLPRWTEDFNAWATDLTRCDAFRCMGEATERYKGRYLCHAHFVDYSTKEDDRDV